MNIQLQQNNAQQNPKLTVAWQPHNTQWVSYPPWRGSQVKAPGEEGHPAAQAGGCPVTKMMSFLYLFYPIQDELIGGFKLSNYLTVLVK